MPQPSLLVLIKFRSKLPVQEVMAIAETRLPDFQALQGLQQKYYFQDPATGEVGGLYLWDSPESLKAYSESDLRKSIAQAYQVEGEPRIEVLRVLRSLRE
jgi:hypothetical protein